MDESGDILFHSAWAENEMNKRENILSMVGSKSFSFYILGVSALGDRNGTYGVPGCKKTSEFPILTEDSWCSGNTLASIVRPYLRVQIWTTNTSSQTAYKKHISASLYLCNLVLGVGLTL